MRNQTFLKRFSVVSTLLILSEGCAVRTQTRVPVSQIPPTPQVASAEELIARLNAASERIQTLTARVDFAPTAGSVYSGVIKEYHDVKGFILLKKPSMIRIIGQAPVVRTSIFDMVSEGDEFRLSIPPKNKFIVGKNSDGGPAKNPLEGMRPQHILDALLVPPLKPTDGPYSFEEAEEGNRRYYLLTVFRSGASQELFPERKVWFDRSDVHVSRLDLFGPKGAMIETVTYSALKDYAGVPYPSEIRIVRPGEDYRLSITIEKATFNAEISPDQFELKQPAGAELVEIGARPGAEPGVRHPAESGTEAARGH